MDTPRPPKDSPENKDYLRKKLERVLEFQVIAKLNGDEPWALTCAAEAQRVEQELKRKG